MGLLWKSSREMIQGEGLRLLPLLLCPEDRTRGRFIFALIGVSAWSMSVVADTMIHITPLEKVTKVNLEQTFRTYIQDATPGQIEQAAKWYLDAERVAEKVAENLKATLEVGASVVSAFSPRERWTSNVAKAISFSLGEQVTGLSNNLRMAQASISLGYEALRGPKTNAFARAIAGDEQAVVVDVWMMRASGIGVDNPNKTQYTEISQAIKTVSAQFGLTPRTTQALIWIMVRGSGD